MREIRLGRSGLKAIVDDEDCSKVTMYKWYYQDRGVKTEINGKVYTMSHIILNDKSSNIIDHKDLDPLNNQKDNLRLATRGQNTQNTKKRDGNFTSEYKGVAWDKKNKKWRATIMINYKQIWLGRFANEIDAAIAYNDAAVKYFNEFARLNIIK